MLHQIGTAQNKFHRSPISAIMLIFFILFLYKCKIQQSDLSSRRHVRVIEKLPSLRYTWLKQWNNPISFTPIIAVAGQLHISLYCNLILFVYAVDCNFFVILLLILRSPISNIAALINRGSLFLFQILWLKFLLSNRDCPNHAYSAFDRHLRKPFPFSSVVEVERILWPLVEKDPAQVAYASKK